MKKHLYFKVLLSLLALTLVAAVIDEFGFELKVATTIILGLFMLKFLGVAFYFMELKRAHVFWKSIVIIFMMLFSAIILVGI